MSDIKPANDDSSEFELVHRSVVFKLSQLLGLFPIMKTYPFHEILNFVPLSLQITCLSCEAYLYLFRDRGESPWKPDAPNEWFYKILSLPAILTTACNALSLFLFKDRLFKVFREMVKIEKTVSKVSTVEYNNANSGGKFLRALLLMKIFTLCADRKCWSLNWSWLKGIRLFVHIICRLSLVAIQAQFTTILHAMEDQMISMIHAIDDLSKSLRNHEIELLIKQCNRIYNACSPVNAAYAFQLLAVVAQNYINVNVSAYKTVTFFNFVFDDDDSHTGSFFSLCVYLVGLTESTLVLLLIVEACSALKNAFENFNKALYRRAICGVNKELQYNEIVSAHFSVALLPKFSAVGFFYLNYEMIYSVCASNVMFIVLALQMF